MNSIKWFWQLANIGLLVLLILPLVVFGAVPSSAQGIEMWNKPCLKAYKKWKTLTNHKAFAISNSSAGAGLGQSCAYTYSSPSKGAAKAAAIKSCEKEKRYRSGRCYVMKSE